MSQSLVLVGHPTGIGHLGEIILGQSTLATSCLFFYSNSSKKGKVDVLGLFLHTKL